MVMKITESRPSPTTVERMVRIQRFFPLVTTFSLDKTIEFENSPKRYPANDAIAYLGVVPRTVAYASWLSQYPGWGRAIVRR